MAARALHHPRSIDDYLEIFHNDPSQLAVRGVRPRAGTAAAVAATAAPRQRLRSRTTEPTGLRRKHEQLDPPLQHVERNSSGILTRQAASRPPSAAAAVVGTTSAAAACRPRDVIDMSPPERSKNGSSGGHLATPTVAGAGMLAGLVEAKDEKIADLEKQLAAVQADLEEERAERARVQRALREADALHARFRHSVEARVREMERSVHHLTAMQHAAAACEASPLSIAAGDAAAWSGSLASIDSVLRLVEGRPAPDSDDHVKRCEPINDEDL